MAEEIKPVNAPEDGAGGGENGGGTSADPNKDLKDKNKLLDDALAEEAAKLEKAKTDKEAKLRAIREERRGLKNDDGEGGDKPLTGTEVNEDAIAKKVVKTMNEQNRLKNVSVAKLEFYQTPFGKAYDPINDPDGSKWAGLSKFLVLRDDDVSKEDILKRYKAAAYANLEDDGKLETIIAQEKANEEAARKALEDKGSGGFSADKNIDGQKEKLPALTDAEKEMAKKAHISEEDYAKQKLIILKEKRAAQGL